MKENWIQRKMPSYLPWKIRCVIKLKSLPLFLVFAFSLTMQLAYAKSDVVGSDGGSISVGNSGQAAWSMPIEVPSGINGVAPKLTLSVSSSGGNGLLGVGGSLSGLSSISRCGKTVFQDGYFQAPQFEKSDEYCLDGARLKLVYGNQGEANSFYRTEIESFQRIQAHGGQADKGPAYFQVTNRNGATLFYGKRSTSKEVDESTGAVSVWKIDKLVDSNGNTLHYNYHDVTGRGETVLREITYGGNESLNTSDNLKVEIFYWGRSDKSSAWSRGKVHYQSLRIANIQSKVNDVVVKNYIIKYKLGEVTGASKIASIQLCGMRGSDGTIDCYRPSRFEYEPELDGDWTPSSLATPARIMTTTGKPLGTMIDVNNDGRTDWIIANKSPAGIVTLETYLGSHDGWVRSTAFQLPGVLFDYSQNEDGLATGLLLDVNGDGWPEYVQAYENDTGVVLNTWRNDGVSFRADNSLNLPRTLIKIGESGEAESLAEVADINADGLVDVIASVRTNEGAQQTTWIQSVEVVNGENQHEWDINQNFTTPTIGTDYTQGTEGRVFATLQDVNGDGLADWVQSYKINDGIHNATWLNMGNGFSDQISTDWTLPSSVALFNYDLHQGISEYSFLDLNGDGLPELSKAISVAGEREFDSWINTGLTWKRDARYNFPGVIQHVNAAGKVATFGGLADLNHDGYPDFVLSNKVVGGSASSRVSRMWVFDKPSKKWIEESYNPPFTNFLRLPDGTSFASIDLADMNHDGFPELLELAGNRVFEKPKPASNRYPGTLVRTVNSLGGKTELNYKMSTDHRVYQLAPQTPYPNIAQNSPTLLVSSVSASNAIGGMIIAKHWYGIAKSNVIGQGGLGYAYHTLLDVSSNVKVRTDFHQTYPYAGKIKSSVKTLGTATLSYSDSTIQLLDLDFRGAVTKYAHPDSSIAKTYDLKGNLLKTVRSRSEIDTYGNTTLSVQEVFDASENLVRRNTQTVNFKSPDFSKWILGLPEQTTNEVYDVETGKTFTNVSAATFQADGKPKTEILEPTSQQWVKTTYEYDRFGNRTSTSVSAAGISGARTNRVTFSGDGRFPVSASNTLGHTVTTEFDEYLGKPISITDANGIIKEFAYDGFGTKVRESKRHQSNGATRGMQIVIPKWCENSVVVQCPPNAVYYIAAINDEGEAPEAAYYDVNGKELRKQTYGSQANGSNGGEPNLIAVDTQYDANGKVIRVTQPYFIDIDSKQPITRPIPQTSYQYDVLGRQIKRINAEGDVFLTQYNGLEVITTNPGNNNTPKQVTKVRSNLFGQPVESIDADGNSTKYEYDGRGKLVKTIDAGGNVATITYDPIFGRKIGMDDPDLGRWEYRYDALGNMTHQIDANGFVTRMRYDELNRLVWRQDGSRKSGDNRPKKEETTTWTYTRTNSPADGKLVGALERVGNSKYSRSYAYDDFARVSQTYTNIEGRAFIQRMGYLGSQDKVDWIEYPSGITVRNTYDDYGFPKTVEGISLNLSIYRQYQTASQELNDALRALEAYKNRVFNHAELAQLESKESLVRHYGASLSKFQDRFEAHSEKKRIEDIAKIYSGDEYDENNSGLIPNVQEKLEEHKAWLERYSNEQQTRYAKVKPGQARLKAIQGEFPGHRAKYEEYNNNRRYHGSEASKYAGYANNYASKENSKASEINRKVNEINQNVQTARDQRHHAENLVRSLYKYEHATRYINGDITQLFRDWDCCTEHVHKNFIKPASPAQIESHLTRIANYLKNAGEAGKRIDRLEGELNSLESRYNYYKGQRKHYAWKAENEAKRSEYYANKMAGPAKAMEDLNEEAEKIQSRDKKDIELIEKLGPLIGSHNTMLKMYSDRARTYVARVSTQTGTYAKRDDLRTGEFFKSFARHINYIKCLRTTKATGRCYADNLVHELKDDGTVDAAKQAQSRARVESDYVMDVRQFYWDRRFFCPIYHGYSCPNQYEIEFKQIAKAIHQAQCARLSSSRKAKSIIPCDSNRWNDTYVSSNGKTYPKYPFLLRASKTLSGGQYPYVAWRDTNAKLDHLYTTIKNNHYKKVEELVSIATKGTYREEKHFGQIIKPGGGYDPLDPDGANIESKASSATYRNSGQAQTTNTSDEEKADPKDYVLLRKGAIQHLANNLKTPDERTAEAGLRDAQLAVKAMFDRKGGQEYYRNYKVVQDKQKEVAKLYNQIDREYNKVTDNGNRSDYVYEQSKKIYWEAKNINAKGQILQAKYGNGTITNWGYDAFGRIRNHITRNARGQTVLSNGYRYDALGNLTYRRDGIEKIEENFSYDILNRLVKADLRGAGAELVTRAQQNTTNYQYDALGNITYKSDIRGGGTNGKYVYGARNAGPHAVTSITGLGHFYYDAVGNQIRGHGRETVYNGYNKPTSITRKGLRTTMNYGPERQLIKQIEEQPGGGLETTFYPSGLFEVAMTMDKVVFKNNIKVAGHTVAVVETIPATKTVTKEIYFHKNHQGSILAISDKDGKVLERRYYDAFGKAKSYIGQSNNPYVNWIKYDTNTKLGFTGHKSLLTAGVIHMGGRVYDATVGRFLSADPHIQSPLNSQSLNRYSYTLNNPLSWTDPSGYFFKSIFKALKKLFKAITRIIKAVLTVVKKIINTVGKILNKALAILPKELQVVALVAVGVVTAGAATAWVGSLGGAFTTAAGGLSIAGGALAGAIAGGVVGLMSTGSLKGLIEGAAFGAITGGFARGLEIGKVNKIAKVIISGNTANLGNAIKAIKFTTNVISTIGHATIGGLRSVVKGGKFFAGVISGGVSKAFTIGLRGVSGDWSVGARGIAVATIGGLASKLAGGSFSQGFVAAGLAFATNELSREQQIRRYKANRMKIGKALEQEADKKLRESIRLGDEAASEGNYGEMGYQNAVQGQMREFREQGIYTQGGGLPKEAVLRGVGVADAVVTKGRGGMFFDFLGAIFSFQEASSFDVNIGCADVGCSVTVTDLSDNEVIYPFKDE